VRRRCQSSTPSAYRGTTCRCTPVGLCECGGACVRGGVLGVLATLREFARAREHASPGARHGMRAARCERRRLVPRRPSSLRSPLQMGWSTFGACSVSVCARVCVCVCLYVCACARLGGPVGPCHSLARPRHPHPHHPCARAATADVAPPDGHTRCAQAAGLSVDQVAPRLSFFFAVGLRFYEEVAKLRAARRLWARLVRAKFAPQEEASLLLRWLVRAAAACVCVCVWPCACVCMCVVAWRDAGRCPGCPVGKLDVHAP
jgi:hypothetical protein